MPDSLYNNNLKKKNNCSNNNYFIHTPAPESDFGGNTADYFNDLLC